MNGGSFWKDLSYSFFCLTITRNCMVLIVCLSVDKWFLPWESQNIGSFLAGRRQERVVAWESTVERGVCKSGRESLGPLSQVDPSSWVLPSVGWDDYLSPRGGSIIIPWLGKTRNQQMVDEEHFVAFSGYPNRALQIQGFPPKYIQVAQAKALQKSCLPSQQCPEHSFSPLKSKAYARWHGSHTDFLLLIRPGPRSLNNIPSLKILHQDPALSIQVSLPLLYLLNKYFSGSGSVVED